MGNSSSVGVRSQLIISDLKDDMQYIDQLLVAKVIYDVYDATEYEVSVYMYFHFFVLVIIKGWGTSLWSRGKVLDRRSLFLWTIVTSQI